MKSWRSLLFAAKLALAIAMLWGITGSGLLHFDKVGAACARPVALGAGFLVTLLMTLLGFFRWHILMRGQGIPITFRETVVFGCVGNFFSTFLPGSVGGDLVKACYLVRRDQDSAAGSLVSIVADRLLALITLLSVVSALSVLGWARFDIPVLNQTVILAGWFGLACLALGLLIFFLLPRLGGIGRFAMVFQALVALRHNWRHTAGSLGVSLVIVFLLAPCFYFFGVALGRQDVALGRYLFAGPFISLSMAVPITPAGIGIGQMAGLVCLSQVHGSGPSFGADLVTLLQIARLVIALPGGFFFLVGKAKGHVAM